MRRFVGTLLLALAAFVIGIGGALAHPHIFIESSARLVFDDEGRLAEIRHHWVFDEAFSAWVTQGLDVNGDGTITSDEMQDLADENVMALGPFEYYTFAGEGMTDLILRSAGRARMHMDDGQVVLDFAIRPTEPYAIRNELEIEVTDPDYYVAFTFPETGGAVLEGAPADCSVEAHAPKPLSDEDAAILANIGMDQVALPPELKALVRDQANIILVDCGSGTAPAAEPQTALEAIETVTQPTNLPFGGPPPELNLPMPKTGFLGWVNAQQKAFYMAMSKGLAAFRSDGSAFLVLGVLSFLYGIFHAAGPGHGKVVISSYMLAGERQLRNGIALSFAAALAQSLTAIIFVLVAAALLSMTAVAMNDVAGSIETVSYGLIILLGLWLLARKLFGWGHHHHGSDHDHDHDHGHGHAHDHDHDHVSHGHHHVVVPKPKQNLSEALTMVLAVGLRPCSGALIVLVFALSQGVLLAGIGAVLLMGLGTALTVSTLASLAVGAKALALKIGSGAERAQHLVSGMEMFGALLLILFGSVMLLASLG